MKSKTAGNRTNKPVGLIYDHIVFHTKYNRKVLTNEIGSRCEEIIRSVLDDLGCECVKISIQPNHVHILVGIPLDLAPSTVAMKIKGKSSRFLRREFPGLVKLSEKALWAPCCSHTSVGNDIAKVVNYIQNQAKKHGGRIS